MQLPCLSEELDEQRQSVLCVLPTLLPAYLALADPFRSFEALRRRDLVRPHCERIADEADVFLATSNACVDTLCKPDKQCAHCGVKVAKGGFVELKREGTCVSLPYHLSQEAVNDFARRGFAAGGMAESQRYDTPFQG